MPAPPNADKAKPARQEAPKTTYEDIGDGAVSGNITHQPEIRYTPNGRAIATLRVAETVRQWNEQTKRFEDGATSFYDVLAWGDMGERAVECLGRGDRIAAVGRWQVQSWKDSEDQDQSKTVLVARDLGPSLLFKDAKIITAPRRENGS